MPDIHDMLDAQVQARIQAGADQITAVILTEFFDGDVLGMLETLEAGPGEYQIEGVPLEGARVQVTIRELATNRTAEVILEPDAGATPGG